MSALSDIRGAVMAALATTASVGGRIFESRALALDRDEFPALVVRFGDESVDTISHHQVDRRLEVVIEIHCRDDAGESAADTISESAHSLIMSDGNLASKIVDISQVGANRSFDEADLTAVVVSLIYRVWYRTPRAAS